MQGILGQAIPGYSGLTQGASGIIGSAISGQVPTDVQNLLKQQSAQQSVMSGMPGTSNISGTLGGNRTLRDLGLTSLERQDTGVKGLLGLLQGVSGTAAPTFGQSQDQENTRAQYGAAPDPMAQAQEQERLFNKYSGNAAPFGQSASETRLKNSGSWYSIDPMTGAITPRKTSFL